MNRSKPLYLLDTNWLVDYLDGVDAYERKIEELGPERLAISAATAAELYEGIVHSRDSESAQRALDTALDGGIAVLDLTDAIARVFGQVRADLRKRQALIGDMDILIASTALHYGIPLCTEDRHFQRIDGLEIIGIR